VSRHGNMGEAPQVTQARRSIAFVVRNRNSAANFLAGPNTSPSDIETLHSPELSVVMTTSNHGELKCQRKKSAPTIEPRIRISRFDDANKRCKVSNQPIRLSAWFLSTQRFTTRSTHPSTRNASSDARHKAGHDDENYEQCEAAVQPCGKRRRPGTADFVRPRTYCVSRSTCASGRDQILFFAAKKSKA
jgi:hypothetical protein